MSKNCPIMQRMKSNYENRSKQFLTRRTPVIIRLDGKAFHTYTKGLDKPFDEGLIEDMQKTAIYLCENIQGAKCAYVQSDEISILLTDYDNLQTQAWFDYNLQKLTSVSASYTTAKFNELRFLRKFKKKLIETKWKEVTNETMDMNIQSCLSYANFDSRVFNIPKEEVNNYFVARQKDAIKNSISMLAQSLYSHKELHGKNTNDMQEMCFQKGHNWNSLDFSKKRGSFIVKTSYLNTWLIEGNRALINKGTSKEEVMAYKELKNWYDQDENPLQEITIRTKWEVVETPEFSKDTTYINNLI